jgi:hypothetical protein
VNLREQKELDKTNIEEKEEDQNTMHKISITKFTEQTGRKEQIEGGKSGDKSHNEGYSVKKDKNSEQPSKDSTPRQHSPLTNHYQSHIRFLIYNE